jgi:hypothetical protein
MPGAVHRVGQSAVLQQAVVDVRPQGEDQGDRGALCRVDERVGEVLG